MRRNSMENQIAVPYRTKAGTTQYMPRLSTIEQNADGYIGYCLACGEEQEGVRLDARRYECENCGMPKVYGGEELVLMGLVHMDDCRAEAFPTEKL
jgi:Zn finger protein HypA/HybF involved in hydrogenase expression